MEQLKECENLMENLEFQKSYDLLQTLGDLKQCQQYQKLEIFLSYYLGNYEQCLNLSEQSLSNNTCENNREIVENIFLNVIVLTRKAVDMQKLNGLIRHQSLLNEYQNLLVQKKSKNWDKIIKEDEINSQKNKEYDVDPTLNFFQQIYANSTEDQRRAMLKSFQTSNGQVLSTDWNDVKQKDYEGKDRLPPREGIETKKINQIIKLFKFKSLNIFMYVTKKEKQSEKLKRDKLNKVENLIDMLITRGIKGLPHHQDKILDQIMKIFFIINLCQGEVSNMMISSNLELFSNVQNKIMIAMQILINKVFQIVNQQRKKKNNQAEDKLNFYGFKKFIDQLDENQLSGNTYFDDNFLETKLEDINNENIIINRDLNKSENEREIQAGKIIKQIYEGNLDVLKKIEDPYVLIIIGQQLSSDMFEDNLQTQKNIDQWIIDTKRMNQFPFEQDIVIKTLKKVIKEMRETYLKELVGDFTRKNFEEKSQEEIEQLLTQKIQEGLERFLLLIKGKFKPIGNFNSVDRCIETRELNEDWIEKLKEKENLEKTIERLQVKVDTLNNKSMIDQMMLDENQKVINDLKTELNQLTEDNQQSQDLIKKSKSDKEKLGQIIKSLQQQNQEYIQEIDEICMKIIQFEKENSFQVQTNYRENEINYNKIKTTQVLNEFFANVKRQLISSKQKIKEISQENNRYKESIKHLNEQNSKLQNHIKQKSKSISRQKSRIKSSKSIIEIQEVKEDSQEKQKSISKNNRQRSQSNSSIKKRNTIKKQSQNFSQKNSIKSQLYKKSIKGINNKLQINKDNKYNIIVENNQKPENNKKNIKQRKNTNLLNINQSVTSSDNNIESDEEQNKKFPQDFVQNSDTNELDSEKNSSQSFSEDFSNKISSQQEIVHKNKNKYYQRSNSNQQHKINLQKDSNDNYEKNFLIEVNEEGLNKGIQVNLLNKGQQKKIFKQDQDKIQQENEQLKQQIERLQDKLFRLHSINRKQQNEYDKRQMSYQEYLETQKHSSQFLQNILNQINDQNNEPERENEFNMRSSKNFRNFSNSNLFEQLKYKQNIYQKNGRITKKNNQEVIKSFMEVYSLNNNTNKNYQDKFYLDQVKKMLEIKKDSYVNREQVFQKFIQQKFTIGDKKKSQVFQGFMNQQKKTHYHIIKNLQKNDKIEKLNSLYKNKKHSNVSLPYLNQSKIEVNHLTSNLMCESVEKINSKVNMTERPNQESLQLNTHPNSTRFQQKNKKKDFQQPLIAKSFDIDLLLQKIESVLIDTKIENSSVTPITKLDMDKKLKDLIFIMDKIPFGKQKKLLQQIKQYSKDFERIHQNCQQCNHREKFIFYLEKLVEHMQLSYVIINQYSQINQLQSKKSILFSSQMLSYKNSSYFNCIL